MEQHVSVCGAGGHAKVVIQALRELGFTVDYAVSILADEWGRTVLGVPIVDPAHNKTSRGVIAVGDNSTRKKIEEETDWEWTTVVHPTAYVASTAVIGQGSVICPGGIIGPDARIGKQVIVYTAATVDHDCVLEDFVYLSPGTHLCGRVTVREGAFCGTGVSVIPNCTLGSWCYIGAGGVVINTIPAKAKAVGVPCRVL